MAATFKNFGLQKGFYLLVVFLQVFFLVWQSKQLEDSESTSIVGIKTGSGSLKATQSTAQKQQQVFRLPNGLPLSPSSIRAFPKRAFPCTPAESAWQSLSTQKSPATTGFLYVKARKASSSTIAGVAIRIARQKAKELNQSMCQVRFNHPMASKLKYDLRDKSQSFLWSILREPSRRFMSEFFHFAYSRNFVQPSNENILNYMRTTTPPIKNYYLQWLSVKEPFDANKHNVETEVQKIIEEYDFLGVSERLDESLVALQMILDLKTSDLLYLSAKVHGGWDDGLYRNQCFYITPTFISPSMQSFFETSEEWFQFSSGDDLLYRAVNASLDRTIATFNQNAFKSNLQRLRWALHEVEEKCRDAVTFPCSENGELNKVNDCLVWDSACGMDCLDQFANDHGL